MKNTINLLPEEFIVRRDPRLWILGGYGILVIGVLLLYGNYLFKVHGVKQQVQALSQTRDQLSQEWLEAATRQLATVDKDRIQKVQAIQARLKERRPWAGPLREISLLVPPGIYLSHVESMVPVPSTSPATETTGLRGFKILGEATSYARITDFMNRMEHSDFFGAPFLGLAQVAAQENEESRTEGGATWIRFEVSVPLRKVGP
jgi:Tfp pilus assembly protein PilN